MTKNLPDKGCGSFAGYSGFQKGVVCSVQECMYPVEARTSSRTMHAPETTLGSSPNGSQSESELAD
ncbi:deacetylase complex subunit Sds3 [Aspergillus luchuensis]|uniref:Deacetylase complex subunit Sds3 n=1 Tax=Aspergillus kawachii TaxID=1069201 RepID=A0A146F8M9_ASPKA|nr:deacetylase complex subunit Sds3 [Aspergillus luchuensis]